MSRARLVAAGVVVQMLGRPAGGRAGTTRATFGEATFLQTELWRGGFTDE